jgi:tetratricopeptide (TPR) repeat protein
VLELVGRWKEAAEVYHANVERAERSGEMRVLADNLLRLGTVMRNSGQLDGAIGLLEKAAELFGSLGDDYRRGRALGAIGTILGDRQDLKKSWEYYERQGLSGDERVRGMAACNKGVNCIKSGEFERAGEFLSESLVFFRRAGELRNVSMALSNLGLVRKNLGDLDGAEELYREAMGIAIQTGDLEGINRLSGTMGVILKLRGRFAEARDCYLRQHEIAERIGDYKGHANALLCLGILEAEEGRTERALELFEKRLALERQAGDVGGTCYTLGNIGLLYRNAGESAKSAAYLGEAVSQCRATGYRALLATYLYNLSSGLISEGRAAEAKPMMAEGLEISEQLGLHDLRFNFRLLEARLLAADDRAAALKILEALEAETATPARSSALAYELALLSKNPRDIDSAIKIYEELCAANPRMEWKKVLEELRRMAEPKE